MDDELFDDELERTERGADKDGSPRLAIASQPIRDGSRAPLHDSYDVQLFHEAAGQHPKLAELLASARERLITAPMLICDLFWSFYKPCYAHSWSVESGNKGLSKIKTSQMGYHGSRLKSAGTDIYHGVYRWMPISRPSLKSRLLHSTRFSHSSRGPAGP